MWKWLHRCVVGVLVILLVSSVALWLGWRPSFTSKAAIAGDSVPPIGSSKLFLDPRAGLSLVLVKIHPHDANLLKNARIDFWGFGLSADSIAFRTEDGPEIYKAEFRAIKFSYWFLCLIFAIYPAIFFIRSYRHRRVRGHALQPCNQCSYDLQGNESGVCPECGEAVEVTA